MNAFEDIVAQILEEEGYWVQKSVKINVTKEEKRMIGKPSIPRPEIDLVAYKASKNVLLLLEVKSYLDSPGVKFEHLAQETKIPEGRYKLFTCANYRKIITNRIMKEFIDKGLINQKTKVRYSLATGKIYSNNEQRIKDLFKKKGWILFEPKYIKDKIISLSTKGYEDNAVTITAKLILK